MVSVNPDPFTQLVAKLILGDSVNPNELVQSNQTHERLLSALVKNECASCQSLVDELNNRELNNENDDWVYNDFTVLLALAASIRFSLDKKSIERIAIHRLKLDEKDKTANELRAIIETPAVINPLSICAYAVAGEEQNVSGFEQVYISIHIENNQSTQTPFRTFLTEHSIIILNQNVGLEIALKNKQFERFLITAAARLTREGKIVHTLIIVATSGWLVFLSMKFFQGNEKWTEIINWLSIVGAFFPIALIISLLWKRAIFLSWYLNFRFKRLGGQTYSVLQESMPPLLDKL